MIHFSNPCLLLLRITRFHHAPYCEPVNKHYKLGSVIMYLRKRFWGLKKKKRDLKKGSLDICCLMKMTHPSIHQPTHPSSIHLFTHPSIHLFTNLPSHPSSLPSIHPFTTPPTHPPIQPSIHQPTNPPIHPPIHPSSLPSIQLKQEKNNQFRKNKTQYMSNIYKTLW